MEWPVLAAIVAGSTALVLLIVLAPILTILGCVFYVHWKNRKVTRRR